MGSESDLVVGMGNSTTIAQIPTSSSISIKDTNAWCSDAANDSKETDSIAEIAKLKKLKSQVILRHNKLSQHGNNFLIL